MAAKTGTSTWPLLSPATTGKVSSLKKAQTLRSYEYKNDFLYIVIRQAPEQGADAGTSAAASIRPGSIPFAGARQVSARTPRLKGCNR